MDSKENVILAYFLESKWPGPKDIAIGLRMLFIQLQWHLLFLVLSQNDFFSIEKCWEEFRRPEFQSAWGKIQNTTTISPLLGFSLSLSLSLSLSHTHTHTHTRVCVCVCMDRYIPFQLLLLMTSMAGLFATIKIKNLELLTPLINLIFPISSS